jgi:hypothetical protein
MGRQLIIVYYSVISVVVRNLKKKKLNIYFGYLVFNLLHMSAVCSFCFVIITIIIIINTTFYHRSMHILRMFTHLCFPFPSKT